MAHEIMNDNAMLYVGDAPWHGLGTRLDIPPNTEEALQLAKLDWQVYKAETDLTLDKPIYPMDDSVEMYTAHKTGYYCTYRLENGLVPIFLGNVSERYEVLQNREAFQPFDEVLLDKGYTYETMGAVKDGKKIWILAKAPESLMIGNDKVDPYVLLFNSHDGSTAVVMRPSAIRVVCNNTLNLALSKKGFEISMKHTQGVRDRLGQVTNMLRTAEGNLQEAYDSWQRMVDYEINYFEMVKYFEEVSPKLKNRGIETYNHITGRKSPDFQTRIFEKLETNFIHGRGNNGKNLWHAYNAVTEYVDHDKNYSDWVNSTQFGSGAAFKENAYKTAVKWLGEAPTPSIHTLN